MKAATCADSQEMVARAMQLKERVKASKQPKSGKTDYSAEIASGPGTALAGLRTELRNAGIWESRLRSLETDDRTFSAVVAGGESVTDFGPNWGRELELLFSSPQARLSEELASIWLPDKGLPPLPATIHRYIAQRLHDAGVAHDWHHSTRIRWDLVSTNALVAISKDVHQVMLPCMATELQVARLGNKLEGSSPEERFSFYASSVRESVEWLIAFFDVYPVLARRVLQCIEFTVGTFVELLERVEKDADELAKLGSETDSLGESTVLSRIDGPLGDRHNRGRAVFLLEMTSGRQYIYKPRPLSLDVAFQEFIRWLNGQGLQPNHVLVPVLDRGRYGYYPFIPQRECTTIDQIGAFYTRQGSYLAIMYLLGSYDFHFENVRACGEFPVLIDLECIVSPRFPLQNGLPFAFDSHFTAGESLERTGFLPNWGWGFGLRGGLNLAALSSVDGQDAPSGARAWQNLGRDDLMEGLEPGEVFSDRSHLPQICGEFIAGKEFTEAIIQGFVSTYELLVKKREVLKGLGSPLEGFSGTGLRVLLRDTRNYEALLLELRHPKYLQHGLHADALIERLWLSLSPRFTERVIESEIEQLWRGDIPYFLSRPDSCDLLDGESRSVVEGYFAESAMEGVARRLDGLSPEDCRGQLAVIYRAFALEGVKDIGMRDGLLRVCSTEKELESAPSLSAAAITEATRIADRLLSAAIPDNRGPVWFGLGLSGEGKWQQMLLDVSLYDGGPGIALFLLYLNSLAPNPRLTEAVRLIVEEQALYAIEMIDQHEKRLPTWQVVLPGGLAFPSAYLYLMLHVDALWGTNYLGVALPPSIKWLRHGLNGVFRHDILGGAASVVLVLTEIAKRTKNAEALSLAVEYGDLMISKAKTGPNGLWWHHDLYNAPMGGLAHGTAGGAMALARLARASGLTRFGEASQHALQYEATLFDTSLGSWTDLRDPTSGEVHVSWCAGAAGQLLAHADALALEETETRRRIAEQASQAFLMDMTSDCLCHGVLGVLDTCISSAERGLHVSLDQSIEQRVGDAMSEAAKRGFWRCGGDSESVSTPGLFMGLAGIGYGLLRLTNSEAVPSVLAFEGPKG